MQLADSIYNKTRDICNQVLECIQQPVGFLSMEEFVSICFVNVVERHQLIQLFLLVLAKEQHSSYLKKYTQFCLLKQWI